MAFSMRAVLVAVTVYAVASLAVSRIVVFTNAYSDASSAQRKEDWLRTQCLNATFYANIGQHSDICEAVQRKRSPVLLALEATVSVGVAPWGWPLCAGAVLFPVSAYASRSVFGAIRRHRKRAHRDVFL